MTESQLIAKCRQQNRRAQKQLYQMYYGKMLNIPMRYTKYPDEAKDVLNRAFLKVFQNLDKYQRGSLSGWIATIVLNTAIDFARGQIKYQTVMDFNAEKEDSMMPEILEQLYTEDLFKEIQKLPTKCQIVFSMYVVDGFKHREIAEKLNISSNTSKWHFAEAKKILQKNLSEAYRPLVR